MTAGEWLLCLAMGAAVSSGVLVAAWPPGPTVDLVAALLVLVAWVALAPVVIAGARRTVERWRSW